jgi:phenylacetate-coenzyme A ligase PaaK-like adenylate-forming protein
MIVNDFLNQAPYSLVSNKKREILNQLLNDLTVHHYRASKEYANMLDGIGFDINKSVPYDQLPFLPVRLFKMFDLLSVDKKDVVKTMTSSGTTGQAVSRIFLDKTTSANQTKVLTKMVSAFLGNKRIPMIIIDTESVLKNRNIFSARGAGILGFSMFGSKRIYALDENMNLRYDELKTFIDQYKDGPIFVFGFTFMIYQHFYKELVKNNLKLDLSSGILLHGGGWKKLIAESISSAEFKQKLKSVCEIESVHDYYGMVEQTGSIFMECEQGHLHAPIYSDVIIRSPIDFSVADIGETGIIQVLSILPLSYPGHSLLTEDEGVLLGEDNCVCGRFGKYFKITGRLKNAEIRGCSDTYAVQF